MEDPAPERPHRGRSGAFFLAVLVALGCEVVRGPELELNGETLRLARGATVHDVTLVGGNGPLGTVRTRPGDAVRFTAGDNLTHAVVFEADALTAAGRSFLEETSQLRGAPLVETGATWVVLLEGAPPGRYPFRCVAHDRTGALEVAR